MIRRLALALGAALIVAAALATAYQAGAQGVVTVEIDGRDYGPAVAIEYTPGVSLRVETLHGPQCVFADSFEPEVLRWSPRK